MFISTDGPTSTGFMIYEDFLNYESGVYVPDTSKTEIGGQAVEVIGWGIWGKGTHEEIEYWITKNSWGTDWGIDGYFYFGID